MYTNTDPINNSDPSGKMLAALALRSNVTAAYSMISMVSLRAALPWAIRGAAVVALSIAIGDIKDEILSGVQDQHIPAALVSLAIIAQHFERFKSSNEFNRKGNHWAEIWGPSGIKKEYPRKTDWERRIGALLLRKISGGKGGRIYQFKYGIGKNANWKQGLFIFRLDYLDCQVSPPTPGVHYHVQWGPIQEDHQMFDF